MGPFTSNIIKSYQMLFKKMNASFRVKAGAFCPPPEVQLTPLSLARAWTVFLMVSVGMMSALSPVI